MSDLIDRQQAIACADKFLSSHECSGDDVAQDILGELLALPSAQPERKKGKWEIAYADHEAFGVRPFYRYCSVCNAVTVFAYNFCPECGADMMEVE